jgi:hypothetical protein
MTIAPKLRPLLLSTLTVAGLSACTAEISPAGRSAGQQVAIEISPARAEVAPGESLQFHSAVTGTADEAVVWEVSAGGGTIDSTGLYTAPPTEGTFTVQASSRAAPDVLVRAPVRVTPRATVTVAVSPASDSIHSCESVTLTATVTGSTDETVTWSVQEGSAGGTVTSAGVYTAPSSAGTYHVIARSRASPAATATATITVTDQILSVEVSPQTVTLSPGETAQFTATVTTSCGAFTTTQTVVAPN